MPSACWDRRYQRSGPEGPETPAETKVTPEGHDTLRAERTSLPEAASNARDMLAWAVGIFAEAVPNDAAGAEPTFAHAVARTVEDPTEELASVQLHVPSAWRVAATQVVPRDPLTSKETFQARSNCPPEADRVMDEPFEETVARTDSVPRATAESSSSDWASSVSASASASSASSSAAAGGSLGAAFCAGAPRRRPRHPGSPPATSRPQLGTARARRGLRARRGPTGARRRRALRRGASRPGRLRRRRALRRASTVRSPPRRPGAHPRECPRARPRPGCPPRGRMPWSPRGAGWDRSSPPVPPWHPRPFVSVNAFLANSTNEPAPIAPSKRRRFRQRKPAASG